ncbi:innate immunity activator protein-like isoform X1 [Stegostoma tigrinum]|uniref:innate immunity activator protein-like isoform X1 n=1 Tax=Stegostoma tigrinum TaxID=3053191 RepID=UPI00202AC914|nr:innate immunity activator protein-like isoform X1 [Stegostoma tigrinum]XP_048408939.1 innate immunity activator protein-like isoform X1 [Stegostoma tigrinum]XP_048408940.1 innate immunity activator protein-like isoform X1 [Stegostoma tigrinum]XP_059509394.1 innate immunity activator protein-like isoform X1 [Stegostoma tigrinum]XP_059509395.1 innate immunity activator protein-like isoform X1 [Stegostoma tigrinum]
MENKDEASDSDSGVILQSGSDSPQSPTKDKYRSVISRKQMLEETLELYLDELKKLCLRESELTGYLPKEYPLAEGEKPPTVRRRIGAAFQLDEKTITAKGEDSELASLERDFALQLQFVEAAKRLSQEANLSRQIRKQRKHACVKEQKKLNEIKKAINEHQEMAGGRVLQTRNVIEELIASDDSSLEDEMGNRCSQNSSTEFLTAGHGMQRNHSPLPPLQPNRPTPPQTLEGLTPVFYQCSDYEKSPVTDTAWMESNLDEPYEKVKRSSSLSSKSSSPTVTPLDSVPGDLMPLQLLEVRNNLYPNQNSMSAPSTPELRGRIHHQMARYLDVNHFPAPPDQRGRSVVPQRRSTNYAVIVPDFRATGMKNSDSLHLMPISLSGYATSESNSSGTSTPTYIPTPNEYNAAAARHWQIYNSPVNLETPMLYGSGFYRCNPSQPFSHYRAIERTEGNAMSQMWEKDPNRQYTTMQYLNPPLYRECQYIDEKNSPTVQRITPSHCRIVRTPSLKEYSNRSLLKEVVSEELQSWHERTRQRNGRPHSLDRQGAFRGPRTQSRGREHYMYRPTRSIQFQQKHMSRWIKESPQNQWYMSEESEVARQF